jgi:fatty acid desaturase
MEGVSSWPRTSVGSLWKRYEGPTWVVATIVYGWWGLLVWFHACIPWWLTIPLGAFVIAWHNSLQHETIHALVRVPRAMRFALGFPPLGLWIPYPIYYRSHRRHHRDTWPSRPRESHPEPLTDPYVNLSIHTARAIHEGCRLPPYCRVPPVSR